MLAGFIGATINPSRSYIPLSVSFQDCPAITMTSLWAEGDEPRWEVTIRIHPFSL